MDGDENLLEKIEDMSDDEIEELLTECPICGAPLEDVAESDMHKTLQPTCDCDDIQHLIVHRG